jgi:hypothetical protein
LLVFVKNDSPSIGGDISDKTSACPDRGNPIHTILDSIYGAPTISTTDSTGFFEAKSPTLFGEMMVYACEPSGNWTTLEPRNS